MPDKNRQQGQHAPGHQQSGSGTHQGSGSQLGKPPGTSSSGSTQDRKKERQSERRSA
jgi:hypothetical protein